MATVSIGSIENGHWVERVPSHGIRVTIPLAPLARRMGHGPEVAAFCAGLDSGSTEVSGLFSRAKRWIKRKAEKVVDTAKDIAKSRVVKKVYLATAKAVPSPYKEYLKAVEVGVQFGKDLKGVASKRKKAEAALPTVQRLARGDISPAKARERARRVGISPKKVVAAAALLKLKQSKDPMVRKTLRLAEQIEQHGDQGASARVIRAQSGRRYSVTVVPYHG